MVSQQTTTNRKQQIIDAALQLIAQKGFEGLRTREIAEIVGVNHATIHYHFKDKETLIEAVVYTITEQMYHSDMASITKRTTTPKESLRTYFQNNLRQRQRYPERFIIIGELTMRAYRTPIINEILHKRDTDWYQGLKILIEAGIKSGDIRSNIDVKSVTMLLITLLRGMSLNPTERDIENYMQVYQQIETNLLTSD